MISFSVNDSGLSGPKWSITRAKPWWPTLSFVIMALGVSVLRLGRRLRRWGLGTLGTVSSGLADSCGRVADFVMKAMEWPPGSPTGRRPGGQHSRVAARAFWIVSVGCFLVGLTSRF